MAERFGPGGTFKHLVIERELGRGAFAVVYLARDTRLKRRVALKVLAGPDVADPDGLGSFLAEAQVIARLNSPHVVTLLHLHEQPPERWVLEMEYVPGGTLADQLRPGQPVARAEPLLRGILAGLHAAHEGGVLHRDLKPANVLLAEDGTAKLTDFGLARVIGDESLDLERDEGVVGTPLYMAPEVLLGDGASRASDLWSVGVVAYRMLSGRLPFPDGQAAAFFFAVQNADPEPLPPPVGPNLRELVARCLVQDPAARAGSCAELIELLDRPAVVVPVRERPPERAAPFFGRRVELERLQGVLARVREGAGATALLTGEPGAGKSALCAELARRARALGFRWLAADLSPVEGPLHTLVQAARAGAPGRLPDFGPATGLVTQLLRGESPADLESREQVVWALEHLLGALAEERPLCLCVDEAHHASEEDAALLADLGRRLAARPFLLLVAARPGTAAALAPAEVHVELGPLSAESLYALLEEDLGGRLPPDVVARVAERSSGNPLLALELMRHLVASGALAREGDRFVEQRRADTVPGRLRDVVRARLKDLDDEDRALLEVAAVDGREFDGRALAAVLDQPLLQVLRRLQRLCRDATLLAPSRAGYRFASAPLQEVLYESMAPELRTELHRALASHLAERGDAVEPERLARHWERCGERGRAAPYFLEAATAAADRQEQQRLVDLCRRAGLLDEAPPARLASHTELVLQCANGLLELGESAEAARLLDRLQEDARRGADPLLPLAIEVRRLTLELQTGSKVEVDAPRLRECGERLGVSLAGGLAHYLLGYLAKRRGELEVAERELGEADRIYRELGDERRHSSALDQLGSVAMRRDRYEEAGRLYEEAAEVAERIGLRSNAAVSRVNGAVAAISGGAIDGFAPDLERAARTFELTGTFHRAGQARAILAELRYAQGDLAGALAAMERALPDMQRVQHRFALAYAERLHGLLLAAQGRLDEAEAALARAHTCAEESSDRVMQATALAAMALVRCYGGRSGEAREPAERALALACDTMQSVSEVVQLLAEAGLHGLPEELLARARELDAGGGERWPWALLAGAHACAAGGDAEILRDVAERLHGERIGPRRTTLNLVADWLSAEAARRAGDVERARTKAEAARHAAAKLGHVWMERALARLAESATR